MIDLSMDANVATLIAGLGGTALGGLIAAVAGWWQANRQRDWQVKDFERHQEAVRAAEVRARADAKALEMQVELDLLARLLVPHLLMKHLVWPEEREDREKAREALDRLARAAALLPEPVRRHVEVAPRILSNTDQLAIAWLHVHPRTVAWQVIRDARRALDCYLRGDKLPERLPEPLASYVKAWEAMQKDIDRQVEEQMQRLEEDE